MEFQKAHPELALALSAGAVGAGGLGGATLAVGGGKLLWDGLTSGFGLKGSAVALSTSAAELSAAAARLGGQPYLPAGVPAVPPGKNKVNGPSAYKSLLNVFNLIGVVSEAANLSTKQAWDKRLQDNQKNDATANNWLIKNIPGIGYLDGSWRDQNAEAHSIRRSGPQSADRIPAIQPGGTEAGVQTGQNIADGITSQIGAIEAAADQIMAAIAAKLSKGFDVPVRTRPEGREDPRRRSRQAC